MDEVKSQISTTYMENAVIITLLTPQLREEDEIISLEQSLLQTVNQAILGNFILNFEKVKFLSSAVLRVLIKVNTAIKERKGQLKLCCIDANILEVFKITRLNKVFDIRKDADAAMASFK